MPLIVISGLPCSSKSSIAQKLKEYFENKKNVKANIISEEHFYKPGENRNTLYSDSNKEKDLRGSLKSEVERNLNKDIVLIFDSLNYVKGFRYELFCISKCHSSTQCTIHCDVNIEDAKEINAKRDIDCKYQESVLEGLFMRYEAPDGRNRWDSPLFYRLLKTSNTNVNYQKTTNEAEKETDSFYSKNAMEDNELEDSIDSTGRQLNGIKVDPAAISLYDEESFQKIYECLLLKKSPKPHLSTVVAPSLPENFLHEVDNITKALIQEIFQKQTNCVTGDSIFIDACKEKISFMKTLSMAELQRIRRQFVAFTRNRPITNVSLVPSSFVQYVNSRTEH